MVPTKAPFYRIVVADQRKKRDGRIIEQVGTYDPAGDPSIIDLDIAKVDEWISRAQPSDRVAKIIASVKNEPLPAKLAERIANKTEANRIAAEEAGQEGCRGSGSKAAEEAAAAEAEEAEEGRGRRGRRRVNHGRVVPKT